MNSHEADRSLSLPAGVEQAQTQRQYRKKPVVIEAFRLGHDSMPDWFCDARTANVVTTHNRDDRWRGGPDYALIRTPEGTMRAEFGDFIVRGIKGELYPVKPDIFAATYEPVAAPLPVERSQDVDAVRSEIEVVAKNMRERGNLTTPESLMCYVLEDWAGRLRIALKDAPLPVEAPPVRTVTQMLEYLAADTCRGNRHEEFVGNCPVCLSRLQRLQQAYAVEAPPVRQEVIAKAREAVENLALALESIRKNDETQFGHHQPRRYDRKTPQEAGQPGTRWAEPREIAHGAKSEIGKIQALLALLPAPREAQEGQ
jgi:hypothetical protein